MDHTETAKVGGAADSFPINLAFLSQGPNKPAIQVLNRLGMLLL